MNNNLTNSVKKERNLIIVCIVFLAAFLSLSFFRAIFNSVDVAVNLWTPTIQSSALTSFAIVVAILFDTTSLVIIALGISGILLVKGYKAHGILLLGAMAGVSLLVNILKNFEQVLRPTNGLLSASSYAYPSGHSAGVVVFAGFFAYFAWQHWHSARSKALVGAGMGAAVGVVGFDRVYLNVHWFSDVLGGWLFGAFWLSFVILVFRLLEFRGLFESDWFSRVANLLYLLAIVIAAVLIGRILFGLF